MTATVVFPSASLVAMVKPAVPPVNSMSEQIVRVEQAAFTADYHIVIRHVHA